MNFTDLQASTRELTGKGISRKLRREGRLPAVLYGGGQDPISLSVDYKAILKVLKSHSGGHSILNLKMDVGADQFALIKDVQTMTMRPVPIHIDLVRISMDKKVEVSIPVEFINLENIKKSGGVIQQILNSLLVECLPDQIPDSIKVDLADCGMGESISVADLAKIEGVDILEDEGEVIVSVLAPKAAEEAVVATEEVAATAEKGKDDKPGAKKDDKAGAKKDDKTPAKKDDKTPAKKDDKGGKK